VLAFGAMPRFLCDAMLGSLARWLRLLGFDTEFDADASDAELAARAANEGRWLLTRDHELAAAGPRSQLVRSDTLEDQLVEILSRHGVSIDGPAEPVRCSMCNGELEPVAAEAVAGSVPPHVASSHEDFYRCERCGKVYWRGTHVDRIEARLGRVRDRLGDPGVTDGR